ncbi:MAG TPA: ABC transporter permease [Candidatus Methanofastidiosa archaeon]|nr:ABC transporter permease [Candidatus Methanofastidiosa archaeon]HPR41633.1 ABC transporter permease [Candidatus Methanofastidiosa archaeon]
MNAKIVRSIVRKDAMMAIRNNLVLIAIIGGVLFSLIYYTLPSDVEEAYDLAIYDGGSSDLMEILGLTSTGGLEIHNTGSLNEMVESVKEGDYMVGVYVPADFDLLVSQGAQPTLTLYFNNGFPESSRSTFEYILRTALDHIVGAQGSSMIEYEVLGEDMAGEQVPLRDRSLSLYIIFALLMEMWTISTLIVEENAFGTLRAMLVTPATSADVISAKSVIGILYTILVLTVILLLTQSLRGNPLALAVCILVSAMFSVSLGLFLGSLTKNITGSYVYVSVPLIIMIIPGMLIFIPDVSLSIVKAIPTYYMANAFDAILNNGAALMDVMGDISVILVLDVVLFALGIASLRRRIA